MKPGSDPLIFFFRFFVGVALTWNLVELALPLFVDDLPLVLMTIKGLESITVGALPVIDRLVVVAIIGIPAGFWIFALMSLHRMGALFTQGEYFSIAIAQHLERFGVRLLLLGIAQPFVPLVVGLYLAHRQLFAPLDLKWLDLFALSDAIDMVAAAALVAILARVLRRGISIEEEQRYTV